MTRALIPNVLLSEQEILDLREALDVALENHHHYLKHHADADQTRDQIEPLVARWEALSDRFGGWLPQ